MCTYMIGIWTGDGDKGPGVNPEDIYWSKWKMRQLLDFGGEEIFRFTEV